jgi:hypothetical protein
MQSNCVHHLATRPGRRRRYSPSSIRSDDFSRWRQLATCLMANLPMRREMRPRKTPSRNHTTGLWLVRVPTPAHLSNIGSLLLSFFSPPVDNPSCLPDFPVLRYPISWVITPFITSTYVSPPIRSSPRQSTAGLFVSPFTPAPFPATHAADERPGPRRLSDRRDLADRALPNSVGRGLVPRPPANRIPFGPFLRFCLPRFQAGWLKFDFPCRPVLLYP